jgi:hypothetical protein
VIRFADKTQIQLGANSTIVLDKFVYDPSSGTADAAIKFGMASLCDELSSVVGDSDLRQSRETPSEKQLLDAQIGLHRHSTLLK